jgi:hypothetical protein
MLWQLTQYKLIMKRYLTTINIFSSPVMHKHSQAHHSCRRIHNSASLSAVHHSNGFTNCTVQSAAATATVNAVFYYAIQISIKHNLPGLYAESTTDSTHHSDRNLRIEYHLRYSTWQNGILIRHGANITCLSCSLAFSQFINYIIDTHVLNSFIPCTGIHH